MRIGVISDTHGSLRAWETALSGPLASVGLIIHVGDVLYHGPRNPLPDGHDPAGLARAISSALVPIIICAGNCDAPVDQEVLARPLQRPYVITEIGRLRIFAAHEVERDPQLLSVAQRLGSDLIIGGHTHVPKLVRVDDKTLLLNPGSPALPKGDNPEPTAAIVDEHGVQIVSAVTGRELARETFLDSCRE